MLSSCCNQSPGPLVGCAMLACPGGTRFLPAPLGHPCAGVGAPEGLSSRRGTGSVAQVHSHSAPPACFLQCQVFPCRMVEAGRPQSITQPAEPTTYPNKQTALPLIDAQGVCMSCRQANHAISSYEPRQLRLRRQDVVLTLCYLAAYVVSVRAPCFCSFQF
jgi:hypothetical protein